MPLSFGHHFYDWFFFFLDIKNVLNKCTFHKNAIEQQTNMIICRVKGLNLPLTYTEDPFIIIGKNYMPGFKLEI